MNNSTIAEIAKSRPNDAWLQKKLSALETEIVDILNDRNRLIAELSKARTTINRIRAGLSDAP